MGKVLGVDIGTTYVKACEYAEDGNLVPRQLAMGKLRVPSLVVERQKDGEKEFYYGFKAETKQFLKSSRAYRAFKMMLAEEEDSRLLKEMGYTDYSPYDIMKKFTSWYFDTLKSGWQETKEEVKLDTVVACAPLVWNQARRMAKCPEEIDINRDYINTYTIDIAPKIRDILSEVLGERVQLKVVSEPEAAGAYYLSRYNESLPEGRNFKGHLLIIDFGGGTLDIALCRVTQDEDGIPVVEAVYTEGNGYNTEGRIGGASLYFFQTVLEYIIRKNKGDDFQIDFNSREAYTAIQAIEQEVINQKSDLMEEFYYGCLMGEMKENPREFMTIAYGEDEEFDITYGDLATCYFLKNGLHSVLTEKLKNVKAVMEKMGIDEGDGETFQTLRVGGFSNFTLTQRSVAKVFPHLDGENAAQFSLEQNLAKGDVQVVESERNMAIAKGAALIGGNQVSVPDKAEYGVGLQVKLSGESKIIKAINFGDKIEFDKEYKLMIDVGGNQGLCEVPLQGNRISEFAFELFKDKWYSFEAGPDTGKSYDFVRNRIFNMRFGFDKRGRLKVTLHFLDGDCEIREQVYDSLRALVPEDKYMEIEED